jgi:hypothetical protein
MWYNLSLRDKTISLKPDVNLGVYTKNVTVSSNG